MRVDNEALREAFRLAGHLLAHQADAAAKGELPLPLAAWERRT